MSESTNPPPKPLPQSHWRKEWANPELVGPRGLAVERADGMKKHLSDVAFLDAALEKGSKQLIESRTLYPGSIARSLPINISVTFLGISPTLTDNERVLECKILKSFLDATLDAIAGSNPPLAEMLATPTSAADGIEPVMRLLADTAVAYSILPIAVDAWSDDWATDFVVDCGRAAVRILPALLSRLQTYCEDLDSKEREYHVQLMCEEMKRVAVRMKAQILRTIPFCTLERAAKLRQYIQLDRVESGLFAPCDDSEWALSLEKWRRRKSISVQPTSDAKAPAPNLRDKKGWKTLQTLDTTLSQQLDSRRLALPFPEREWSDRPGNISQADRENFAIDVGVLVLCRWMSSLLACYEEPLPFTDRERLLLGEATALPSSKSVDRTGVPTDRWLRALSAWTTANGLPLKPAKPQAPSAGPIDLTSPAPTPKKPALPLEKKQPHLSPASQIDLTTPAPTPKKQGAPQPPSTLPAAAVLTHTAAIVSAAEEVMPLPPKSDEEVEKSFDAWFDRMKVA